MCVLQRHSARLKTPSHRTERLTGGILRCVFLLRRHAPYGGAAPLESLARRQAELEAAVQGNQTPGEAGRQALIDANRQLLEVMRLQREARKRYVLVRTEPTAVGEAVAPAADGTICGVPASEVALIDDLDEEEDEEVEAEARTRPESFGASLPG